MNSGSDLPLVELYTKLREAGLPIGIDEYQSVLRAMQGGFGINDRGALKRLCQTVWVKSTEEKQLFEYHFEKLMAVDSTSEISNTPFWQRYFLRIIQKPGFFGRNPVSRKKYGLFQITRYVILGSLALGIVLGVKSSSQEGTQKNLPTTETPTAIPAKPVVIATQKVTLIPTSTPKPQSNNNNNQSNWIFWFLLPPIVLSGGYVIFSWVRNPKPQQNISQKTSPPKPTASDLTTSKDEVQIAQAVLANSPKSRFLLTSEYFPVNARQMKQIWRYLRRPVRQGSQTELDVEATVNQIGHQGLLLEPVLRPIRVNRAEMLLLIDQDGSMVPFGALSLRVAETAIRGGRLGKAGIYYFHNCPLDYLYHDPNLLEAELVSDVVTHVCSDRTAVLILSDAGAARGGYSEERYELTKEFLAQLKQRVRYIAWLNPMPRSRWNKTTAGEIASLVPMFEVSRRGLQDAIGVLRGRPTNFEGRKL